MVLKVPLTFTASDGAKSAPATWVKPIERASSRMVLRPPVRLC